MTKKNLQPIKTAPYDIYTYGLNGMREREGKTLTLEEARDLALADAEKNHAYEHIDLIKAAYEELKKQEKK